jgi:CHAD domain-containing protein
MKPEAVSTARFQRTFATMQRRNERAVRACIKRPTPEAIHEARITVRKLTTTFSLMPKEFRRDTKTVRTMKALRLFYTACARTRDVDSAMSALSIYGDLSDLKGVIAGLKKHRSVLLARVLSSGDEVSRLALPRPTDDTRRRLRKRLNRLLDERAGRASYLYWIAAGGKEKVTELHNLRKECRHIMYLLDFVNEDAGIKAVKTDLEDAREKLGSIRDDDVLLDMLRSHEENAAVAEVAAAVSAGRLTKYRKFFSSQTAQGKRPKLLESILSLT